MAPKKSSSKFNKGSSQSEVKCSNASSNRKRPEKLGCLRECKVMLNSDGDKLHTRKKSKFKRKKKVLKMESDANPQNAVRRVSKLLQKKISVQHEHNMKGRNEILVKKNKKTVQEDIDVCYPENDQLTNRQEIRPIGSQPNKIFPSDSAAEQGRIKVKNEYTLERCAHVADVKSIDLARNQNSENVMIKFPGSNSYRQRDCVCPDAGHRNRVSAGEDGVREESLSLPTHTVHGQSVLGMAAIDWKAGNCNKPMDDVTNIFSGIIDLEDSSPESGISHKDECDNKIFKSEYPRNRQCFKFVEESNSKPDVQIIGSKIPNVGGSEMPCTMNVQSETPTNDSVSCSEKTSKITYIFSNNHDTHEKLKLSKRLYVNDHCIGDQNSKTIPLQDYLETPFLGFPTTGGTSKKGISSTITGEVENAFKKVLCERFDYRPPKSSKYTEKTELVGVNKVSRKACSLPLSCTSPGSKFSSQRGTSVCNHTYGHCVVCNLRSTSLNQGADLPIDQSSTDVENNEKLVNENLAFSIHINFENLIQAKRHRACYHSSDTGTSEHQKWQTSVHDRTRKEANVHVNKSESKNVAALLPCRSCSFRAISDTVLEQHSRMHEKLLTTEYTDTRGISADTELTTMQTLCTEGTAELMGTKGKCSTSGVFLLTSAIQCQTKKSPPVITTHDKVGIMQTPFVQANPSSPTVIFKPSEGASEEAETSVLADPLPSDSKTCHDYSNVLTTQPKYYCKYCGFSCVKQQKQANHMRFCPLSTKRKQSERAPRRSHQRKALLGAFETDYFSPQDKSNFNDKVIFSGNENLPTIIKEEPELDTVPSEPANTTESTSRDIPDITTNLSTKKLPRTTMSDAHREVLLKCSLCDFTTVVMDSLARHCKHHHHQNDLDTLLCPMCAYETTDAAEMRQHFSQSCVHSSAYREEHVII